MKDRTKNKINFSYFAAASVNMMSVLAGVGYAWSSPCIPKLIGKESNPLPKRATFDEIIWITSLLYLGAIFGPLLTGIIAAKIGKKKTLMLFSIPQILSNVLLIFADRVSMFYAARFLAGLGIGCVFSLVPVYVAEISDANHRGRTSLFLSLMITSTQDLVFIIGPYVTIKTLALISLVPSLVFFLTFGVFVPESPFYYATKNQLADAQKVLIKSRQTEDVDEELSEIVQMLEKSKSVFSFKDFINSKSARKSFLLSFGLMFFQQFNGVAPIGAYQQSIFDASNSSIPSDKSVMIVGLVPIVVIFAITKFVDTWGRKKLLMCSYLGQLVSLLGLSIYFHLKSNDHNVDSLYWLPLTSILIYMLSFKMGSGPVTWTVTSEIFPPNYKFILSPLIAFCMNVMSFLVTFVFPQFWETFGLESLFWGCSCVVAVAIPFIHFLVPETKEKTLLEIQKIFEN